MGIEDGGDHLLLTSGPLPSHLGRQVFRSAALSAGIREYHSNPRASYHFPRRPRTASSGATPVPSISEARQVNVGRWRYASDCIPVRLPRARMVPFA